MPTGAMKVALCFSAANMKMVKTSSAVKNISMNRPRTMEVSTREAGVEDKPVVTFKGPGKRHETIPAAAIAPSI